MRTFNADVASAVEVALIIIISLIQRTFNEPSCIPKKKSSSFFLLLCMFFNFSSPVLYDSAKGGEWNAT